ncbi:unnamed protein product [Arctogadus glacialis]
MISALIPNVPTNKLILAVCVFTFDLHTLSNSHSHTGKMLQRSKEPSHEEAAMEWWKAPTLYQCGCYGIVLHKSHANLFSHPTALINLHMRHFSSLDDVHFCKAQTGRE